MIVDRSDRDIPSDIQPDDPISKADASPSLPPPVDNDEAPILSLFLKKSLALLRRWQQYLIGLLVATLLFFIGMCIFDLFSHLYHSKGAVGGGLPPEIQRSMPRGILSGAAREIREGLVYGSTHLGDGFHQSGVAIGSGISSAGRGIGFGLIAIAVALILKM